MLHYVTKNDKENTSKNLCASYSVIYGWICQNIWGLCIVFILNTCIKFNHMSNWYYFASVFDNDESGLYMFKRNDYNYRNNENELAFLLH